MRALSRLADVAGFWTLDRTTITGRSAVILRQHTTPFRPMIVPLDDLELVLSKFEKLKPLHTRKFPRVSAQDSRLGPIQPWDVKDFLRLDRGLTPHRDPVLLHCISPLVSQSCRDQSGKHVRSWRKLTLGQVHPSVNRLNLA
jgi:hypothetical protein